MQRFLLNFFDENVLFKKIIIKNLDFIFINKLPANYL